MNNEFAQKSKFYNELRKRQGNKIAMKIYMKAKPPTGKDKTIEENNKTHSETKRLMFLEQLNGDLINVIIDDMQAHRALYDFCLGKKLSTIYTHEMHAYQTVMDYLKSNFIEIKDYADDKE